MKTRSITILFFSIFFILQNVHTQPKIGQVAPSLSGIRFLDRQPELAGRYIVVDFWATWCNPCVKAFPHLNNLAKKYQNKIIFLALSDEKESTVSDFLQKTSLMDSSSFKSINFGLDTRSEISINFGIMFIPTYFLISPDNIILATGNSAELSEKYLDSVLADQTPELSSKKTANLITSDSVEKVSSILITSRPGSPRILRSISNSLLIRDTLRYILPYLDGVSMANRVRWEDTPKDMIEVNIYSEKTPVDSLKRIAHNMILSSYGIRKKEVIEKRTVWTMKVKDAKRLKDSTSIQEDGVAKRNMQLNDSIYQCDNFSIKELAGLLENFYFPRIIKADDIPSKTYDWNLEIVDTKTKNAVPFEQLIKVMLIDFGIEFKESVRKEVITVYY